jgi:hypothetical protein
MSDFPQAGSAPAVASEHFGSKPRGIDAELDVVVSLRLSGGDERLIAIMHTLTYKDGKLVRVGAPFEQRIKMLEELIADRGLDSEAPAVGRRLGL